MPVPSTERAAAALVLALARGEMDDRFIPAPLELHDRTCAAPQNRDVQAAVDLARRHQVAALSSWMLEHRIPPPLRDRLRAGYPGLDEALRQDLLHHLVQNECLLEDLGLLTAALKSRGVPHLILKGPWLAWAAYPHPGARPMGDIDLCVPEESFAEVTGLLMEAGYASDTPLPSTGREALHRCHYGRQIRFAAPGRTVVELHFRLVNLGPPGFAERWIWDSAREIAAGRFRFPVPGREAMLLHLLLHANQHAFSVLRLLHDIRWALETDGAGLDWDALTGRVRDLRCARSAYHALLLARDLAGAQVSESVLAGLQPSRLERGFFARCWRLNAVRSLSAEQGPSRLEAPLFVLLEIGGWRSRAVYLWRLVERAVRGPEKPPTTRVLGDCPEAAAGQDAEQR